MVTGTGRKPDVPRRPAQMARFDGQIMDLFRADLPERKKRFPSWAGAEKFAADLNFRKKKNGSLLPAFTSFYERSNSGYAIKPKKPVKRQTDTKMQWNKLKISLSYSFQLRKSKV